MKSTKFKEDSVMSQPSAGQPSFTSGRKDDTLEEMSAGATGSGSIASVASPTGKMQKRAKGSIFSGISTSEKFPNSKAVKESNDYFKRRKDEEERIAGTKSPAKRTPKQTDYEKKRKEQREVAESQLSEEDIILMPGQGRRLKPGLISKRNDNEIEMARNDLYQTAKDAKSVCDMLQSVSEMQGLDAWVQSKITKAADYLSSVRKYLEGKTTQGSRDVEEGAWDTIKGTFSNLGYSDAAEYGRALAATHKPAEQPKATNTQPSPVKSDKPEQFKKQPANENLRGNKQEGVAEGSEKMTPREKFNRGLKRQGFDPEAAAGRLEKLIAKQKQEREEFEKAMPDVYGKKEVDEEKQGLWANIHAKRERIQHGSGERMRKPGSKGAPTADALKKSAKE